MRKPRRTPDEVRQAESDDTARAVNERIETAAEDVPKFPRRPINEARELVAEPEVEVKPIFLVGDKVRFMAKYGTCIFGVAGFGDVEGEVVAASADGVLRVKSTYGATSVYEVEQRHVDVVA